MSHQNQDGHTWNQGQNQGQAFQFTPDLSRVHGLNSHLLACSVGRSIAPRVRCPLAVPGF